MNIDAITTQFPWLLPLGTFFIAIFLILLVVVVISALQNRQYLRQQEALQCYVFPLSYFEEVKTRYPHLTETDVAKAFEQLRFYFTICRKKEPKTVAMPSKLVDVCWHIFITDTRHYRQFCDDVYGKFLHHMPKVEVTVPRQDETTDGDVAKVESKEAKVQRLAVKAHELEAARVYQWAVMLHEPLQDDVKASVEEHIAVSIPLLFSIDQEMRIADGYCYPPEVLQFLATYDLEAAESAMAGLDSMAGGSVGMGCGDGGSAVGCGGCGGST
ncbi:MAG: hypothetical protein Q7K57_25910 [Burkholderiaceae bacterium]|nr:hypothetical protein [Burkholderiaceae bacterium]